MKLPGKIVLVTGGNSGIGRAIALRAAAEGARVAITGRSRAKGERVLGELLAAGTEAAFFAADLGEETQAAQTVGLARGGAWKLFPGMLPRGQAPSQ